jgi:hypothetical protein
MQRCITGDEDGAIRVLEVLGVAGGGLRKGRHQRSVVVDGKSGVGIYSKKRTNTALKRIGC